MHQWYIAFEIFISLAGRRAKAQLLSLAFSVFKVFPDKTCRAAQLFLDAK